MKKVIFLFGMVFSAMTTNAQITVNSNGSVNIGSTTLGTTKLTVGQSTNLSYDYAGISSTVSPENSGWHIGVIGDTYSLAGHCYNSAKKIGVYGTAGDSFTGCNFGVVGALANFYGAGVYGTVGTAFPSGISGQYAGYFNGNVYILGNTTLYGSYTVSDASLKENISSLSDNVSNEGGVLKNVLDINVVKYNYKDGVGDDINGIRSPKDTEKTLHFGVLAQELMDIYPNLVKESEDGTLAVNYVELIPVLIQSIKELNQKVEELSGNGDVMMAKGMTGVTSATAVANKLYQNTPNPFKETTVIRFSLADDAADAAICIFDMTGKQLKRIPVSRGQDSISVNGTELGAGMFLYSLIVNGKEIDTKRMILSK